MINFTINLDSFKNEKWTPKFSNNLNRLIKWKDKISDFDNFILKGPTNGIDVRNFVKEGKNYIRILDIKRYFISYADVKKVNITNIPSKIKLKKNDILISRKGTPGIASIVTENNLDDVIGTEAIQIRLKDNIDPYYFIGFLNSKFFYNQVLANLSGGNSVGINHPALKKLKIIHDKKLEKKVSNNVKDLLDYENEANILINKAKNNFYKILSINFKKFKNQRSFETSKDFFNNSNNSMWIPQFSNPKYLRSNQEVMSKFKMIKLDKNYLDIKKGFEPGSANYIKYKDRAESDLCFSRTSDFLNNDMDAYSDFYLKKEISNQFKIDIKPKDVLFSKDGKIGMCAMVCPNDDLTIASGIIRLRLKKKAFDLGLTPEYLFLNLALNEFGGYFSKRYTVVASTIPHLNQDQIYNFEIPLIKKNEINKLTDIIKKAFDYKDKKKKILKQVNADFINLNL